MIRPSPGIGPVGLNVTTMGVGPVAVAVAAGTPVWRLQPGAVPDAVAAAAPGLIVFWIRMAADDAAAVAAAAGVETVVMIVSDAGDDDPVADAAAGLMVAPANTDGVGPLAVAAAASGLNVMF